jgi:hypothetical protein
VRVGSERTSGDGRPDQVPETFSDRVGAQAALQIPFTVLLTRNFVDGIPDQLLDAVRVDGARMTQARVRRRAEVGVSHHDRAGPLASWASCPEPSTRWRYEE